MTDVHDLAELYALELLEGEEQRSFERHLRTCPTCERTVHETQEVGVQLARLVATPPPEAVRARVLDAVGEADADEVVDRARQQLLTVATAEEVVGVVDRTVQELGGWTVPAEHAGSDSLPLDVSLGRGGPRLITAVTGSQAHRDLQRHLPSLLEDARLALEAIVRSSHRETSWARPSGDDDDPT